MHIGTFTFQKCLQKTEKIVYIITVAVERAVRKHRPCPVLFASLILAPACNNAKLRQVGTLELIFW